MLCFTQPAPRGRGLHGEWVGWWTRGSERGRGDGITKVGTRRKATNGIVACCLQSDASIVLGGTEGRQRHERPDGSPRCQWGDRMYGRFDAIPLFPGWQRSQRLPSRGRAGTGTGVGDSVARCISGRGDGGIPKTEMECEACTLNMIGKGR